MLHKYCPNPSIGWCRVLKFLNQQEADECLHEMTMLKEEIKNKELQILEK